MSCRNETSPTTKVVGLLKPAAKPAAVLSTPSIPRAPLLDPTGIPTPCCNLPWLFAELAELYEVLASALDCCLCQVAYMSMSLMGMLLPMKSPLPVQNT